MKWSRSFANLAAVVVVLSLVGVAAEADANNARRDSLAGNRLILDRDDIFTYPQLAVNYANRIGFDYGAGQQEGTGLLLMGDERSAFGVAIHRNYLRTELFPYDIGTAPLQDLTPAFGFQQPGTIVDLIAGFDVGGGLAGVRLSLGRGATSDTPADGDESSSSETLVNLEGGYSILGPLTLDTSLRVLFSTGEQVVAGDTTNEGTLFGIGLSGRGYTDIGQPWELGFLGDLVFSHHTNTTVIDGDDNVDSTTTGFWLQGGAGPVWEIEEQASIAGYGVLGFANIGSDPNANDDDVLGSSVGQFILPGVHLGADISLTEWLSFRSGAQYMWSVNTTSQETDDGDDTESASGSQGDFSDPGDLTSPGGFGWNAGFGLEVGDFNFDGSLQHGFLLNGPNFIGGGAGFMALASAEYGW
jgi:hypothetical protein